MKGLKKNLIYWGISFERLAMAMLAGIAIYAVMMCFMGGNIVGEGAGIEEYAQTLLGYLWMFALIGIFMNGFTAALSYYPMSISLGSTRKASYVGMQIMQHAITFQYLLIGAIGYYVFDREIFWELGKILLSIIGIFLGLIALTNVTCIISAKFGKIAAFVVYIVSLVLIVVTVVIVVLSGQGAVEGYKLMIQNILLKPYVFIGALVADAVTIGIYYSLVKKQDLQF